MYKAKFKIAFETFNKAFENFNHYRILWGKVPDSLAILIDVVYTLQSSCAKNIKFQIKPIEYNFGSPFDAELHHNHKKVRRRKVKIPYVPEKQGKEMKII